MPRKNNKDNTSKDNGEAIEKMKPYLEATVYSFPNRVRRFKFLDITFDRERSRWIITVQDTETEYIYKRFLSTDEAKQLLEKIAKSAGKNKMVKIKNLLGVEFKGWLRRVKKGDKAYYVLGGVIDG